MLRVVGLEVIDSLVELRDPGGLFEQISVIAVLIPALRAARVDLLALLRQE